MKNKFYLFAGIISAVLGTNSVYAAEIDTNMAQMQAMDKITGKVKVIEVPVGGEIKFGSFSVVVRSCKTNAENEIPENFAFVDVTDKSFDQDEFNIFKGWMFSSSPAVNAVEHPIYDVWLLKCFNGEPKPEQLLSEEALAARDNLPRLADVREEQKQIKENTFNEPKAENNTIEFKDSMYKEEKPAQENEPEAQPQKADGEPENLLNIKDSYESDEEETITVPAKEFSEAVAAEEQSLQNKALQDEAANTAVSAPDEEAEADDLSAAIDAELAKQHE